MLILMHTPSDELFMGALHPAAALYEDYIDLDKAIRQHNTYQNELRKCGADVRTIKEILLQDTLDADDNPIEGRALEELRRFASRFLTYNTDSIPDKTEQQEAYKRSLIAKCSPNDLVRIILRQPQITLSATDKNTGLQATYSERPVMNAFFQRDPVISTTKGIVVGRMHSPQRQDECRIVEFCLDKLGIKPVGRIEGDGYLEGGDFLPFENMAFIGCGLRTNDVAIETLLKNNWLGVERLVVVKDRLLDQRQMHLDTYFNIIDSDLVTLSQERLEAMPDNPKYLTADVWTFENGTYHKTLSDKPFVEYLTDTMRAVIVPVSRKDEDTYACNFLMVSPRKIMAVAGQSAEFTEAMQQNRVDVTWVELSELTKGYGAAHCMTQDIR